MLFAVGFVVRFDGVLVVVRETLFDLGFDDTAPRDVRFVGLDDRERALIPAVPPFFDDFFFFNPLSADFPTGPHSTQISLFCFWSFMSGITDFRFPLVPR